MGVEWLKDPGDTPLPTLETLVSAQDESAIIDTAASTPIEEPQAIEAVSTKRTPPAKPPPRRSQKQAAKAKRQLGMGLTEAQDSATSIAEVASQHERPGVITPSRSTSGQVGRVPLSADQRDVMEADHGILLRPAAVIEVELGLTDEVPEKSPFIGDDE